MGNTNHKYKKKIGGASTGPDAVRNVRLNTLPQTGIQNAFHMLAMIMPLLSTMTLLIIFMVNAKWFALVFYFFGLLLLIIPGIFGMFSRLNTGAFRDNPLGLFDGLNFSASTYNVMFLINSLFPFGLKAPTIDSPEFWTTFLIITAFMIMDMVHKIGFKKTKGLIRLNLGTDNTNEAFKVQYRLFTILFLIPIGAAISMFTSGAYAAENFNSRELFYLQESYSDRKCSPCEQKNAINDARDAILAKL
tara:strand:- start:146 stop:886 length:741 start_codon:yes stop_codon:yes gene_type:complete